MSPRICTFICHTVAYISWYLTLCGISVTAMWYLRKKCIRETKSCYWVFPIKPTFIFAVCYRRIYEGRRQEDFFKKNFKDLLWGIKSDPNETFETQRFKRKLSHFLFYFWKFQWMIEHCFGIIWCKFLRIC